jgi:hypothetical protein
MIWFRCSILSQRRNYLLLSFPTQDEIRQIMRAVAVDSDHELQNFRDAYDPEDICEHHVLGDIKEE